MLKNSIEQSMMAVLAKCNNYGSHFRSIETEGWELQPTWVFSKSKQIRKGREQQNVKLLENSIQVYK